MFSTACKGNLAVEKCLFTGILRIAQANLLSGLNNPSVYTLLDSKYAQHYGFTQEEINHLFEGKKLDEFEYPVDKSIVPARSSTRKLSNEHAHKLRKETKQKEQKGGESQEQGNELTQELARIYNGYRVGAEKLYNPWSIINVLSDKVLRPY